MTSASLCGLCVEMDVNAEDAEIRQGRRENELKLEL
jgi:hypothetical protein